VELDYLPDIRSGTPGTDVYGVPEEIKSQGGGDHKPGLFSLAGYFDCNSPLTHDTLIIQQYFIAILTHTKYD